MPTESLAVVDPARSQTKYKPALVGFQERTSPKLLQVSLASLPEMQISRHFLCSPTHKTEPN